jgi:hypothetical protein
MITCPWCGTNYLTFQPNCAKCGGPLQVVGENVPSTAPDENLAVPPPAPRPISDRYIWRLIFADGGWITALILGILGFIFSSVGAGLTIGIITAFVGIPFLLIGLLMLGAGGGLFFWRYQAAQQVVNVLRIGDATRGQIVEVQEDYSVSINDRHPWVIRYCFQANGQDYQASVSTMNPPGQQLQVGKAVSVLYLPQAPKWSSIYPHP